MIKVERSYNSDAFFNESQESTWDKRREKIFKVSLFGLTIFKRTENLNINYDNVPGKKVGFKGNDR